MLIIPVIFRFSKIVNNKNRLFLIPRSTSSPVQIASLNTHTHKTCTSCAASSLAFQRFRVQIWNLTSVTIPEVFRGFSQPIQAHDGIAS